jgi:nitroreductase
VPPELVYRVLDNARFAPSGGNRQGWHVIVVSDRAVRAKLADLYARSWYEYHARLFQPPGQPPVPFAYADNLAQVPVHLVITVAVAGITTTIEAIDGSRIVGGAGIYPFVHNIVLGLRAEGLGAAMTTVLTPVEAEVRDLLGIPDNQLIAAHVGVGWPARRLPTRLARRPVADFATVDAFDGEPFRGEPFRGQPGP